MARLRLGDKAPGAVVVFDRAAVIRGSADAGAGAPTRTASSCAANATPRNNATEDRLAQSSRAKIPVNGPFRWCQRTRS